MIHHGLGPNEWYGARVVAVDESIDVIPELLDIGEGSAGQGVALENGEPDLDLVEPGAVGRGEVEADIGMAGQPAITIWYEGPQVFDDYVDFLARMVVYDEVHEFEELDTTAPFVEASRHLAGCHC